MFVGSSGLYAGWGILVFATVAIFLFYLLFLAFPQDQSSSNDLSPAFQILSEGKLLLIVIGATKVVALIERRSIWSYGLSGPRPLQRFLWGAFWGALLLSLLIGVLIATRHLAIEGGLLQGHDIVVYGLAWAATFVIAAVAEETLFRGYLQFTLARILRFWPTAILMSAAFGLVHLTNTGEGVLGVFSAALAGAVFCLCLRFSGSLWWGIGFHAAWNWTQSFLYGTPASGYLVQERLLQTRPLGGSWWSGGVTGPETSILVVPTLCLAALVIMLTFGRPHVVE